MIVKIEDVGFNNKGAALMLYAIVAQLKQQYGENVKIVVENYLNDFQQFASLDLYKEASFQRYKIKWHNFISEKQLLSHRLVKPSQIDVVLNASGFSVGDIWYPNFKKRYESKLKNYKNLHKSGAKIIYLPQAFGAFTKPEVIDYCQALEKYVDVFFAREKVSHNYLQQIISSDKVKLFPDFTNLLEVKENYTKTNKYVVIIPNTKMINTTKYSEENYISFLKNTADYIHRKGYEVVLLNHEGHHDENLLEKLSGILEIPHTIETDKNAIEVKQIIKSAYAVISSRFHGAVSSLCQGVPLLVTSWSHKYGELLMDYKQEECIMDMVDKEGKNNLLLEKVLSEPSNTEIRTVLNNNSVIQKELSQKMWNEVFKIIDK